MKEDYEFEWDSEKAKTNSRKHGISFPEAETIWDDPQALEVHLVSDPEDRWAIIGRTAKNCYLTLSSHCAIAESESFQRASRPKRR